MTIIPANTPVPVISLEQIGKRFGSLTALSNIDFALEKGQVHCLLGDNGAGKSTLINILSGVHRPSTGILRIDGKETVLASPRQAINSGIATVFQDLALIPLMSITRNFFLGREPTKGKFPMRRFDLRGADRIVKEQLEQIGLGIRNPQQPVGTLSGGERQCIAIARALYHGARILILDEPTSALGVHQASIVLRYIADSRQRGVSVIFITHNVHHAFPIADVFTVLDRGEVCGTFRKDEISESEILDLMSGRRDLEALRVKLARPS